MKYYFKLRVLSIKVIFNFVGIAGDIVEFNREGDGLGRYDVYQYQQLSTGRYEYVKIGEWIDRYVRLILKK